MTAARVKITVEYAAGGFIFRFKRHGIEHVLKSDFRDRAQASRLASAIEGMLAREWTVR